MFQPKMLSTHALVLLLLLIKSCGATADSSEKDTTPSIEPQIIHHFYSEPQSELASIFFQSPDGTFTGVDGTQWPMLNRLVSVPTGQVQIEYETTYAIVNFSPDGLLVAKMIPSGENPPEKWELSLCRTKDDSEVWRVTSYKKGDRFESDFVWDLDRGVFFILSNKFESGLLDDVDQNEQTRIMNEEIFPASIKGYSVEDGSVVCDLQMDITWDEYVSLINTLGYGDGKFLLVLKDDPFKKNRNVKEDKRHIYLVDPFKLESAIIDISDAGELRFTSGILITDNGKTIFFDAEDVNEHSKNLGGDLWMLDVATGEKTLLAKQGDNASYHLDGISADGHIVSCREYYKNDEGEQLERPFILNSITGAKIAIDPKYKKTQHFWVSPSGEYVMEWHNFDDIWIHDLKTGETTLLVSSAGYPAILPLGFMVHQSSKLY